MKRSKNCIVTGGEYRKLKIHLKLLRIQNVIDFSEPEDEKLKMRMINSLKKKNQLKYKKFLI